MRHLFTPENIVRASAIKTNERLVSLVRKYGTPRIDFFGDSWRVWFTGWHHHARLGLKKIFGEKAAQRIGASYSSGIAEHGKTLDECLDRLEASIADVPPSKGDSCREGCPYYELDLY